MVLPVVSYLWLTTWWIVFWLELCLVWGTQLGSTLLPPIYLSHSSPCSSHLVLLLFFPAAIPFFFLATWKNMNLRARRWHGLWRYQLRVSDFLLRKSVICVFTLPLKEPGGNSLFNTVFICSQQPCELAHNIEFYGWLPGCFHLST